MGRSSVLAQLFVVAADEVGVTVGDGIAVNWDEGVVGLPTGQFVGDSGSDFHKWLHDLQLHDCPVGFFALASVFLPSEAGALAGNGDAVAQFWNIDHFLNIAQAIGPRTKIVAGDGTSEGRTLFIKKTIPIAIETATDIAAFVAAGQTSAIAAAASAIASALSELRVATVLIVAPLPIGWGEGGICAIGLVGLSLLALTTLTGLALAGLLARLLPLTRLLALARLLTLLLALSGLLTTPRLR
jgi:hypothetical protein